MTMLNGLGMCMLSLRSKSKVTLLPAALLLGGTALFPGIIFYEAYTKDLQFHGYVKYGGMATIIGWFAMALV